MSKHTVVAAIFARGGSKGVPGKNLKVLGGRSLIAHAVSTAKAVRGVDRVLVSTDDAEIAEAALQAGAEVPFMRPVELAQDNSPEWLAWRHAIDYLRREPNGPGVDTLLSIPTTSPLRRVQDVENCLTQLRLTGADCCLTVAEASRNPYFNMVKFGTDGYVQILIQDQAISRRQDAPEVFDITTVAYAVRADYVMQAPSLLSGRVTAVVVDRAYALDIDTPLDLEMAEFLWERRNAQP